MIMVKNDQRKLVMCDQFLQADQIYSRILALLNQLQYSLSNLKMKSKLRPKLFQANNKNNMQSRSVFLGCKISKKVFARSCNYSPCIYLYVFKTQHLFIIDLCSSGKKSLGNDIIVLMSRDIFLILFLCLLRYFSRYVSVI